jgi:hypothetical protein
MRKTCEARKGYLFNAIRIMAAFSYKNLASAGPSSDISDAQNKDIRNTL